MDEFVFTFRTRIPLRCLLKCTLGLSLSSRRLRDLHRLDECRIEHDIALAGREQTDAEILGKLMKMQTDSNHNAFSGLDSVVRTPWRRDRGTAEAAEFRTR